MIIIITLLAPSHQALASRECRAAAMEAEQRKRSKYSHLEVTHCFIPVAVETLGAMGPESRSLFKEIARRIKITCGEETQERAQEFLLQRVAVAVQMGECRLSSGGFTGTGCQFCQFSLVLLLLLVFSF